MGHTISNENPDLIYANDPRGYIDAISLKKKYPKINMIFNLLDIPWFMPNILNQTKMLVKNYLDKADAVTVLSQKVKKDLSQFSDRKIHVIYNPVRDVYYDENIKKENDFLFVGRANDPNKRFNLIKEGFQILGHTVSNENPDLIYANDPRGYDEAISLKKNIQKLI